MKITFLLNGRGEKPSGGFKVVYEYANGLTRRGHEVTIVHPARVHADTPIFKYPEKTLRFLRRILDGRYRPDRWFLIDDKVHLRWVPSLKPRYIPSGDIIVATAWTTAEWVSVYPPIKGKRFYLIQHLETFNGSEERVLATWHLPLRKIVISRWLQKLAEEIGENAVYIPNGLDFEAFGVDAHKGARSPNTAMMMYHQADWKGSADGLKALSMARERIPALKALLFGVEPAPQGLPGWTSYFENPAQDLLRKLYNQACVFIGPSWTEGWGLPPAEAMMCGCAVAATDIGGHREFAQHDVNALLSPAKDPSALADNILRLIQDEALRVRLARAANASIRSFTWSKALDAFERTILDK
jgi:glycosyltransferase involved in cell wall biosynthesis